MELYTRRFPVEPEMTPNCDECSRSLEHAVCTVLHLSDGDWLIEQTPHRDVAQTPVATPRLAA